MTEISRIERDKDVKQQFASIYNEVHKVIIGNEEIVENILIALFSSGHVLLESVPGMGKTALTNTIAGTLDCVFKRVQCTPDLAASDIVGMSKYNEVTKQWDLVKGPVFTNILLVDEINRAPPKTQAALLEAMAEEEVTLGGTTHELPKPFIVIATQNPIEQSGTYPLPEAQLDRFMFKSVVKYLSPEEEIMIMKSKLKTEKIEEIFNPAEIRIIQKDIFENVFVSDSILEYAVNIINETRSRREIMAGGSPRASIAFMKGVKARAFIEGRDYGIVEDVKKLAFPILRHRILLYPHFSDMGMTPDDVISKILQKVEAPMD
ncbi:MAG: magnesium chelatase [Candidatus Altiarchaeales archaeon ex4484_2]|nr:MAG: magnesium chelatase [Candidatus Altiarchaeales archaeon ex4484_2]